MQKSDSEPHLTRMQDAEFLQISVCGQIETYFPWKGTLALQLWGFVQRTAKELLFVLSCDSQVTESAGHCLEKPHPHKLCGQCLKMKAII